MSSALKAKSNTVSLFIFFCHLLPPDQVSQSLAWTISTIIDNRWQNIREKEDEEKGRQKKKKPDEKAKEKEEKKTCVINDTGRKEGGKNREKKMETA